MTNEDQVAAGLYDALRTAPAVIAAFGGRPVEILDAPPSRSLSDRAVSSYPAAILQDLSFERIGEGCAPDILRFEVDFWDRGANRVRLRDIVRASVLRLNDGFGIEGHTLNFIKVQRVITVGDPDPDFDRKRLIGVMHVTPH